MQNHSYPLLFTFVFQCRVLIYLLTFASSPSIRLSSSSASDQHSPHSSPALPNHLATRWIYSTYRLCLVSSLDPPHYQSLTSRILLGEPDKLDGRATVRTDLLDSLAGVSFLLASVLGSLTIFVNDPPAAFLPHNYEYPPPGLLPLPPCAQPSSLCLAWLFFFWVW